MTTWKPIEDYSSDPASLGQSELKYLAQLWPEQRERLEQRDAFIQFNERLNREWAVETGLIERLYHLDRGITQPLIEKGIHAALIPHTNSQSPRVVSSMIMDHQAVVEGIFQFVKGDRELSTGYIKQMHALMTRNQHTVEAADAQGNLGHIEMIHGDYKRWPNNPSRPDGTIVHEYCPPEHTAAEMDRLIELHQDHKNAPPEVEAAWLHHRFTQIHPFQDGNGRIARALATLVLVKAGWFPLVVRNEDRDAYIEALETADRGNLLPLVVFFAGQQRREFIKALSIAGDLLDSVVAEDAIRAVRGQLQRRRDALLREWDMARSSADTLRKVAVSRLQQVRDTLQQEMVQLLERSVYFVDEANDHDQRSHYFRWRIIGAAKSLGYYANTDTYRCWARLVMRNEDGDGSELLISFHGLGQDFRGLLAGSAIWFRRIVTDPDEQRASSVVAVCNEPFQINYKEPVSEAEKRFRGWLEHSMVRALDLWQSTLV